MTPLEVGARVYVIAEKAPSCRAGVVQVAHARAVQVGQRGTRWTPKVSGYTVLHDEAEPDPEGLVEALFKQKGKRDWNWTPHEVVPYTTFELMVAHCNGDASTALAALREEMRLLREAS